MDEDNLALNNEGEDNIPSESPTEEKIAEEVPESLDQEASETETQDTETEVQQKKGFQSRVRELNQRAKNAEEEVKTLKQTIAELTGSVEPTGYTPQYVPQQLVQDEPIVKPGEEIDALELDRRIKAREQKILQQTRAEAELRDKNNQAILRINNEVLEAIKVHPELDPDSESFNQELSDAVSEAVEGYVSRNPYSAKVKNYVDKLMRPYKGALAKEAGKATENIAKQVSSAALRPTSLRRQEKTASEKSIEELEAELGVIQS